MENPVELNQATSKALRREAQESIRLIRTILSLPEIANSQRMITRWDKEVDNELNHIDDLQSQLNRLKKALSKRAQYSRNYPFKSPYKPVKR